MPIAIWLKDPKVSILVKGSLTGTKIKEFNLALKCDNQGVMVERHNETDQTIIIPTGNVAMMQYLTDEEVKEAKEKAESDMKKRAAMGGGGGSGLINPTMLMPSNRSHRSRR